MRLFESLGKRDDAQPNTRRFFHYCYETRSTIVHGEPYQPTSEEVMAVVGPLNWAVRDPIERHVGFRPTSGLVDQAAAGGEDRAESGE